MPKLRPCAATILLLAAVLSAGCGSEGGPAALSDRDLAQFKVVGLLYGRCMQAKNGAAPANEQEFINFIQKEPENWNKLAATPKELLTSPRDGQPLVVLYGRPLKDAPDIGFPWIAHEKTGADGEQMAISSRGDVQPKTSEEIAQLFPSS